ncbi:MAG: ABC transporter permease [Candidatus Cloacimonetes bacterium]|nr:ABC transporter permease [Candidatus Cloacimonadota bacterium]MCF7813095.1 ABC transporter permease [Candidatus Cloacimonadota bacterium]MCF7867544.1 ABC transporter permease [Candidatus Cloacimonadota bacterium]MCF7883062.1 ABC transporter permease [Candidatus Cloacimonadota bacterium]
MFHYLIALRYLKGRNKIFFSLTNLLSVCGIIIGVFALLVVSSVMNGFDTDMRKRVIGSKAEIKIHQNDYSPIKDYREIGEKISSFSFIKASAPVCETELMIQKDQNLASTLCFGIDYEKHHKITEIINKIVVGVPEKKDLEEDGIIIGLDLSLTINATVGEYVQLISPVGTEPSPFGLLPKSKKLKVVGIFSSGMPEYDQLHVYISLNNAQYYLGFSDEVNSVEVKTIDANRSRSYAVKIQKLLGSEYVVEDWSVFDANLFNAMKMEKIIMYLVLALMIIIASFNMTGNFVKLVTEKKVEIGVLKAMGASEKDIIKIFIFAGTLIGIIGVLFALVLALGLLWAQLKWQIVQIPVPGFPLQWLPVEMRTIDFILVPLIAIIISFVSTILPAKKTVKIDPIKIIRN